MNEQLMSHYQHTAPPQPGRSDSDGERISAAVELDGIPYGPSTLDLVRRLCAALEAQGITYCHWKSNNALDRSASGDNDLDFLVSRPDMTRFTETLSRLGFKQATAPAEKQLPGVLDYFGYDHVGDKLVHVHAHYQLVLGHDRTKNFRLPIEEAYLQSVTRGQLFRVPASEFEFVVFVVRMIVKHSTWDVILSGDGRLGKKERQELAYLQERIDQDRVYQILKEHLPYINTELFNSCLAALEPTCSIWTRVRTGRRLQKRLRVNARRPLPLDTFLKLWRRAVLIFRRRILKKRSAKYCLASGGAMIAIVGGDGAGKSTAVDGLYAWLSKHFAVTRVHMGKPTWSWTTIAIRSILKIGNLLGLYPVDSSFRATLRQKSLVSPGYPWLLRELCKARDRYYTYLEARRLAANGGLVILDRFPLSQIKLMDGPQVERFVKELTLRQEGKQFMSPRRTSALVRFLKEREDSYYQQTVLPEVLIALRVDPEIAVQRKTDEAATSVRERSTEVWELDWNDIDAHLIDASRSRSDVLAEIKALIWSDL